jgi:hypothetical protein
MASVVKSTSGATNTYVITDAESNTLTVTLVTGQITGLQPTFVSSASGLHADGINALAQLMLQMGTGVVP